MPQANLTLTIPEQVWIGEVSRSHPDAEFRILAALVDDRAGVGLAELTARDIDPLLASIRDAEEVTRVDVLQRADGTALVQFETTTPLLLLPIQGSGVPLEMPFTIRDGRAEWDVTAPQRQLSELADQLETFGIRFAVNEVRQRIEPEQLLTDRQLMLVHAAVEEGYYDTPRECSLTELAESVEIAKSTASETLHRAEERIVKEFVEDVSEASLRTG